MSGYMGAVAFLQTTATLQQMWHKTAYEYHYGTSEGANNGSERTTKLNKRPTDKIAPVRAMTSHSASSNYSCTRS